MAWQVTELTDLGGNTSVTIPALNISRDGSTVAGGVATGGANHIGTWSWPAGVFTQFADGNFTGGPTLGEGKPIISPDGTIVIGAGTDSISGLVVGFTYLNGAGPTELNQPSAPYTSQDLGGIGADDATIAAVVQDAGLISHAAVYHAGAYTVLPEDAGNNQSTAYAASDDGLTVYGFQTGDGTGTLYPVKWTLGGAMPHWSIHALVLPAGYSAGVAIACSADGTMGFGYSVDAGGNQNPTYWAVDASHHELPQPAGSDLTQGTVSGCSLDTTQVCGWSTDALGNKVPCLWSSGVLTSLPLPMSSSGDVFATGIDGSGAIIVGLLGPNGGPLVWTPVMVPSSGVIYADALGNQLLAT